MEVDEEEYGGEEEKKAKPQCVCVNMREISPSHGEIATDINQSRGRKREREREKKRKKETRRKPRLNGDC